MIIAKRLKGKAISAWIGPTGEAARRAVARAKQRITSAPQRLDFYYDITDPWSYVTAQAVARLLEKYPVELAVHVITPPASDVDGAPTLRPKHAVRDCQQLAAYWDVDFPGRKEPDPGMVRDIATALIRERPATDQLAAVLELGSALWKNDRKWLVELLGKWGTESHGEVAPILNTNYDALRKAGHYQGAMLHWHGTWTWGIDRLPYMEAELAKDFGTDLAQVVKPRPPSERGPQKLSEKGAPLVCEMWFSFRSPYSYIALEQIETLLAPYKVPLVLRPVAPMVTRGIPLPGVKKMYIARDAKREADRLGIDFGEICDPLGTGVDHCLAIVHWALQRSPADGMAFARSALRGAFAEARDLAEYVDLRAVVERAGLPWEEARAQLDKPDGAKAAAANVADMNVIALWGVPSFRIGDFVAWGQDRLPLLADRLRRDALANARATESSDPSSTAT